MINKQNLRMKRFLLTVFCMSAFLTLYAQNAPPTDFLKETKQALLRKWPENRTINLVFHGHSVPSGYFNTPNVKTLEAYPQLTLKALKEVYPYAVVNAITTAVGGENAEQGSLRFEKEVLSHRPDVLFIDYALNDRGIGLEKAKRAWESMIREAQKAKIPVILMTPTPDLTENILDNNTPLEKHALQIRRLAATFHTGLVDSYAAFKEKAKNGEDLKQYMSQSNHPNAKGHEAVCELIIRYLMDDAEMQAYRNIRIKQIMTQVADWQLMNFENRANKDSRWENSHACWAWTNATLYVGMAEWAKISGRQRYWDFLYTIGEKNRWKPGPNIRFADDICVIQSYLQLYEKYKEEKMIKPSIEALNKIMDSPHTASLHYEAEGSHSRWCWCDALFMAPTAFARMGKITGDKRYFDFMDKEFWTTYDSLYCPQEKLFFRDTRYKTMREENNEKVFWGRGNGWVTGGLTIIIDNLPDDYPSKFRYINLYKEMMTRIAGLQDSRGFWHPSLLDATAYPMPETSASGFFAYGLLWGINRGYLNKTYFLPKAQKAWDALCSAVHGDGKLGFVQAIGSDPKRVSFDDTEVYGVGAFLLAGKEMYQLKKDNAKNTYYFFTGEDLESIGKAAKTGWGTAIVNSLKQQVEERRKHVLSVPLLEGGHLHHYFCPVHNIMLGFDWDKPHAHYCRECKSLKENDNRLDWAWVNVAHAENLKYLMASMYLYQITKDTVYAGYIRDMMLDYASKYPAYVEHNIDRLVNGPWGGRMFGQSLDEAVWASDAARAYQIAKPVMNETEIRKIENGYLKPCAALLLKWRGGGNWQMWHNSGLIALGVALQNDSLIDIAVNDPQCGYHRMMELHVYNDGWWNEGSPIYHYYPLRAMLLSAETARCRNINLYNEKLHNMFVAPASGVYADLHFPAHNDGWHGESLIDQAKLYEIAYIRFKDPFLLNILKESYKYIDRNQAEALLNPIEIIPDDKPFIRKSAYFKDLGVAVLISGNNTVVLKYGPHGGVHGHPDKLSVSIHDGKKEILPDMGTSAYGVPDFTQWYRKTLSHSTLTVDAKDQKETAGKLLHFNPTEKGGFVEAESNEAYPDVKMSRSLNLDGNRLTDIFTAVSGTEHLYDYMLMLNEKPEFTGKGESFVLNGADAYTKISGTEKRRGKKSFTCKAGNHKLSVTVLNATDFEIITGTAPGIPPSNPAIDKNSGLSPAYPLIIRLKSKDIKVKTEWKLNENKK
jgi:rhamnogalacturonyl hydrolase YesR/lysophospholipase L1-like esterase